VIVGDPAQRARDLITFADGLEEGGFPDYASRARATARDALELAEQLEAARSMNDALHADRDRLRNLLAQGSEDIAREAAA
jgi:hypothetical protein